MQYKTLTGFQLDANDATGVVEHLISTMGIVDRVDDVIHPGAYLDSIRAGVARIRVLDQHGSDSVLRVIGKPLALRELARHELPGELLAEHPEATGALWAKTQFLLDVPEGLGAYKRIVAGAVNEYSIGYDALQSDHSTVRKDGKPIRVRNLRRVKLWEYSPVVFAAGVGTQTLSVKGRRGRRPTQGEWNRAFDRLYDYALWLNRLHDCRYGAAECDRLGRQYRLNEIERGQAECERPARRGG